MPTPTTTVLPARTPVPVAALLAVGLTAAAMLALGGCQSDSNSGSEPSGSSSPPSGSGSAPSGSSR